MNVKSKILIIDDSQSARELLMGILQTENYDLDFASNGIEGLEKARISPPDLILLDIIMPEMDGYEVCRRLRQDPELKEVPVLFLSSLEDRKSRLKGIEAGADDFLTKPFDVVEMLLRIGTITRLNRYRRIVSERARFAWLTEHTDDGYLLLNADDSISYANAAARQLLALPDPIDKPDTGPFGPESFLDIIQRAYELKPEDLWESWNKRNSPLPVLFLVQPETQTAQSCWIEVTVLQQSHSPEQRLVRLRNITKRMTGLRDVWSFHSMISHKLRTPLSGILFSLELMSENAESLPPEDVKQMSSLGLDSARRLNDEIEDILDYMENRSPAEGEYAIVEHTPALLKQLSEQLNISQQSLTIDPALNQAHLPFNDRSYGLILWHLLENAVKFHPEHNPQLEINLVQEQGAFGRPCAKLIVRDDGLHLSSEQLRKVWSPYYQVEKTLTFEVSGMGLGLSLVANIVWNVGGSCRIANREDGKGIQVELLLPLRNDEPLKGTVRNQQA